MYVLLEFWQKNHCDPYYEPTIVVHDIQYCVALETIHGKNILKNIHIFAQKLQKLLSLEYLYYIVTTFGTMYS